MVRHWNDSEFTAACKAYAKVTLNPLIRADQNQDAFEKEIKLRVEDFSPPDALDGT